MNTEEMITDLDRYPTLSETGRAMLEFLREHPHAPVFRNQSGNRLKVEDVKRVRDFEEEVRMSDVGWPRGRLPEWLPGFVSHCFSSVPFYRRYGSEPAHFEDIPVICRADLGRDIAMFVPDNVSIDRLINFQTTGTTGHSLLLPSDPIVAASYLAFHKRALRRFGIELQYGAGQVGVVLIGYQRTCFTYVSVTPTMNESGLAKINLHPADWRDPADRARYLDALAPEVITGDPISFEALAGLPCQVKPRAIISTSMMLLPGLKEHLEDRFGCPVLDIYSMNEAGPIAVADPSEDGHVLLQHCMYVEILNQEGRTVPPGQRGEVCLTGGFNFCLPLLRYRTGDHASIRHTGREPVLDGLEGRPPVLFRTMSGSMINNIDITHALRRMALPQYTVHQNRDGSLAVKYMGSANLKEEIRFALLALFGQGQLIEVETGDDFMTGKVVQYTSEVEM
ncbi:MAG: AMP-binding protein [Deltaproteobacteria bacterium]